MAALPSIEQQRIQTVDGMLRAYARIRGYKPNAEEALNYLIARLPGWSEEDIQQAVHNITELPESPIQTGAQ